MYSKYINKTTTKVTLTKTNLKISEFKKQKQKTFSPFFRLEFKL